MDNFEDTGIKCSAPAGNMDTAGDTPSTSLCTATLQSTSVQQLVPASVQMDSLMDGSESRRGCKRLLLQRPFDEDGYSETDLFQLQPTVRLRSEHSVLVRSSNFSDGPYFGAWPIRHCEFCHCDLLSWNACFCNDCDCLFTLLLTRGTRGVLSEQVLELELC